MSTPRPIRWGLGDVGLGVIYVALFVGVGFGLGIALRALGLIDSGDSGETGLALGVMTWAGLQLGLGSWPFVVSRWKGRGPVTDWRLSFKLIDIPLGLGTAIMALGAGGMVAVIVTAMINLDDDVVVSNTQPLDGAQGTPWLYVMLVLVVVIGPGAEEVFFRGLTLRAMERRIGTVAAVIGSTSVFAAAHYTGGGFAETAVIFAVIGTAGAVFAVMAVQVGRLWPAIFGHMLFNALAAAQALDLFDQIDAA